MFGKVRDFFSGLSFPTKEVSGERLYQHLINIGIDAEVIPEGSPDAPGPEKGNEYSFSIKVKGLNIDVIRINRGQYLVWSTRYGWRRTNQYRIVYIVRDSGQNIQKLEENLDEEQKRKLLMEQGVSLDWQDHCVRIYGVGVDFLTNREMIIDQKERVKYVFLMGDWFPSLETLELCDKQA